MLNKDQLRKKFLKIRKKNYYDVESYFFTPLIKLLKKKFQKKNLSLALYYPSYFELNVLKVLDLPEIKKTKTLLPTIDGDKMFFSEWTIRDVLKVNKYGMLEPYFKKKRLIPKAILVPLLAFDMKYNRLGYGKGFYDKFLNKYMKLNKNILTIGVAFSFQKYNKIPSYTNDAKLNYILTEKGIN